MDSCLICKTNLKQATKINILFKMMKCSEKNLQEFIQELLQENVVFKSSLICEACYQLLLELDDLLFRSKAIQQTLLKKYITPKDESNNPFQANEIVQNVERDVNFIEDTRFISLLEEEERRRETDTVKKESESMSAGGADDYFKTNADCNNVKLEINQIKKEKIEEFVASLNAYCCEICGHQYNKLSAFKMHLNSHKVKYNCDICQKAFTQKIGLIRHLRIHTGENPYKCTFCEKRFIHHSSFKHHVMSHMGRRDHVCDVCGLTLMSLSHLKRHMKTHTAEKNFNCIVCGRKFAERYNMKQHCKKVHGTETEIVGTPMTIPLTIPMTMKMS